MKGLLVVFVLFAPPCWGACSGTYTLNSLPATKGAAFVNVPQVSGCYSVVTHVHADIINSGSSTPAQTTVNFVVGTDTYWLEYVYADGNSKDSIDEDFWIPLGGGRVLANAPSTGHADIIVTYVVQSTPN